MILDQVATAEQIDGVESSLMDLVLTLVPAAVRRAVILRTEAGLLNQVSDTNIPDVTYAHIMNILSKEVI